MGRGIVSAVHVLGFVEASWWRMASWNNDDENVDDHASNRG